MTRQRHGEQGSSLFETLLAMGLLAGVLGSIAGLFVIGASGVKSGRSASEALSVAHTVIEEMQGWDLEQLYLEYGLDGSASSYIVDTRSNADAAKWQVLLDENLSSAYATIAIASLEPSSPALQLSSQIRVMVTIYWAENTRQRKVRLGTVRM